MNHVPAVSVLLPTMAGDPWLDNALLSILAQEGVDLEVILIRDGASNHGDPHLVGHSAVRVLNRAEPKGLAAALNAGLELCTHEFVARLDSDDVSRPGRLLRQVEYMERNPSVAVLGARANVVDEDGRSTGVVIGLGVNGSVVRGLLFKNALVHPSVMMRKSAVMEVGGYDEKLSRMEDYELWLRCGASYEIHSLQDVLVDYRVHSGQMSRSLPSREDYRRILRSRVTFSRANGFGTLLLLASFVRSGVSHVSWKLGLRQLRYLRGKSDVA